MGSEAVWTEKAKEDWAKYRAEFEAYIPGADTETPEEIAKIREYRRQFMDYAERTCAGRSDPYLTASAEGLWHTLFGEYPCISVGDMYEFDATLKVLRSRGYDVDALRDGWVKAVIDRMVSEGEPLAGRVRAVLARATNKETGEVSWPSVEPNLHKLWAAASGWGEWP